MVAKPAATRENGPVGEGRPPRERLVCIDCGLDLDPAEPLEIRLANRVMKVCPACMGAVRDELDGLLGGWIRRVVRVVFESSFRLPH